MSQMCDTFGRPIDYAAEFDRQLKRLQIELMEPPEPFERRVMLRLSQIERELAECKRLIGAVAHRVEPD